jgi:hypothetical protein
MRKEETENEYSDTKKAGIAQGRNEKGGRGLLYDSYCRLPQFGICGRIF